MKATCQLQYEKKVNIKHHFHEFKLLLEQLTYVEVPYTHDDNVETILNNLPKSPC